MRNIETHQVSFERGMIENWKQDSLSRDNALQSVLWLANYNPNLEHLAAIIRPATNTYRPVSGDSLNLNLVTPYSFMIDQYSNNKVIHNRLLRTSNPKANDTHINFIRRYAHESDFMPKDPYGLGQLTDTLPIMELVEATGITATIYHWSTNQSKWVLVNHEPFWYLDNFPDEVNTGWFPLGTMSDCVRYGESMLFTTTLVKDYTDDTIELIKPFMYPCYLWNRFDITKQRDNDNQFWNGITFNPDIDDKNVYTNWIVKKPSRLLKESTGLAYIDSADNLYDNETGQNADKEINLVIWESDAYDNAYFPKLNTTTELNKVKNVMTFEMPNRKSIEDKCIDDLKNAAWTAKIGAIEYRESSYSWDYPASADYSIKDVYCQNDNTLRILDLGFGYASFTPNYWKWVMCSLFPNYIESNIPRLWCDEDVIPLVLTMVVNNIEIIVYRGTYKVQDGAKVRIPESSTYAQTNDGATLKARRSVGVSLLLKYGTEKYYISPAIMGNDIHHTQDNACRPNLLYEGNINEYPMINFSLRITENGFTKLLENNVSSIKLYVSEPGNEGILRSTGVNNLLDPPPLLYKFPKVIDPSNEDYNSNFRLVKEFKINGNGTIVKEHKDIATQNNFANEVNSNAWLELLNDKWSSQFDNQLAYWAIPQEDEKVGSKYPNPRALVESNPTNPGPFNPRTVNYDLTQDLFTGWTPDFILWDYPSARPPLNIESSGKNWEGIGARLIAVIKSRSFIGGCINNENVEEQAILRYSLVQSGIASPDIFMQEHKIQIGHQPFTAMLEFREQLLVFNKDSFYRIIMPNVFDQSTWEFVESVEGTGTYSPKTAVNTPHGFVFGNSNGLWLSTGNIPQSLTEVPEAMIAVTSLYQTLMTGEAYTYQSLVNPGYINKYSTTDSGNELDHNPYLELIYDDQHDELVLITPIDRDNTEFTKFTHVLRMIFNFKKRNWRIELYDIDIDNGDEKVIMWSDIHRTNFPNKGIHTLEAHYSEDGLDNTTHMNKEDISLTQDALLNMDVATKNIDITGEIITHELGDGVNDFLLHSSIIECTPTDGVFSNDPGIEDPQFLFELRNKQFAAQAYSSYKRFVLRMSDGTLTAKESTLGWFNMMWTNLIAKNSLNAFTSLMQIPKDNDETFEAEVGSGLSSSKTAGRESLYLLAPINTKARKLRFKWISKGSVTAKISSIVMNVKAFRRRHQ